MTDHPEPSPRQPEDELGQRLATLWRVESPRMIARLMRQLGDLGSAEEIAQDAFMAAIEKWPQDGVPDNPAAWLSTTARFLGRVLAAEEFRAARHDTGLVPRLLGTSAAGRPAAA